MVNAVDQVARDMAMKAQYSLDAHEAECVLRYAAVEKSFTIGSTKMAELKKGQDRILSLIVAGGVATISTLFGASYFLAVTLAKTIAETNGIRLP